MGRDAAADRKERHEKRACGTSTRKECIQRDRDEIMGGSRGDQASRGKADFLRRGLPSHLIYNIYRLTTASVTPKIFISRCYSLYR